ncbi:CapA family protein [Peptoniphilus stercorisuis]|uniref:Poly-gamma-glutamate synthesis protein (Capsule biosynthesis protein) n=1 Tax=Peptoniphilus stercorisuis TaxID=1436965 RepID=A0ABS4KE33_9FIRM|nr:poly-gamma-glutamate synthesis protein (capsule biosynthesis protein) [Peptoniphilus stercorisuis]
MKKKVIVVIVFIMITFTAILYYINNNYLNNIDSVEEDKDTKREITIVATGDIIYHMPLYINTYDRESDSFDFSSFYKEMKDIIDSSDIMVGNYETTSNENRVYSGYPSFNTPKDSIKYLKDIGFDILSTANNHCLDTGVDGIISTIDAMDEYNIKHFGTYKEDINRGVILEENNIKVGFLSYSEYFNGLEKLVPEDKSFMISKFNLENIKNDINNLKIQGANFIVIYPHWGVEYSSIPSEFQVFMNKELLKAGADVVLGSHPHVLQPVEYSEIDAKKKFSIYSMGNSISNQRMEWMNIEGTETGVFVKLKISKKDSENTASLEDVELIPTYVNRYKNENNKFVYEVVSLKDYIEGGIKRDSIDEYTKKKVDRNYENAMNILYSLGG